MKLFITGGAGFIGSNFIRYLLTCGRDFHVVNFDKLTYAGNLANLDEVSKDRRYSFVQGDICDPGLVTKAMTGCDSVVHFAAESHVDRSIFEPSAAIETNLRGTFTLLQAARKAGVQRFVQISTDEVYGDIAPGSAATEASPLRPSSPYSASKAGADHLVLSFVRTFGVPALITRSSNNYGPFQFPEKFLPLIITNAMEGKPLPIYGDGRQQRNWLHVEDNCRAILEVLERGETGEVYNIGGDGVQENLTIAKQVLNLLGKPESLLTTVADRPGHDRRYALDSSKIRQKLGWAPRISLTEGLQKAVDWYKTNAQWVASVRGGEYRNYYKKYYEERDSTLRADR